MQYFELKEEDISILEEGIVYITNNDFQTPVVGDILIVDSKMFSIIEVEGNNFLNIKALDKAKKKDKISLQINLPVETSEKLKTLGSNIDLIVKTLIDNSSNKQIQANSLSEFLVDNGISKKTFLIEMNMQDDEFKKIEKDKSINYNLYKKISYKYNANSLKGWIV